MFIVKKGEGKKNLFITHYEVPTIPEIKLESIKPQKIQPIPKIKEKEQEQEQIKKIEKNNIIIQQQQIPHNLFCIFHNQNKVTITPPKVSSPHLRKKRFIDDDSGNIIGRWSREEHKKFIEAIIKFGNNWKEVQEYVNSRTSTQARSHAQKFFEKIKKNNTLKFFDSLVSDYSENFTNATILQLHNLYGNKSKSEINNVVNKFLSLEYDLPKKRRKMINNNNGLTKKKNIGNKCNNDNNSKNMDLNENEEYECEEQEENDNYKVDNNNYENNENIRNNSEQNNSNNNNNENNTQNYYQNNSLLKQKMMEERNYLQQFYYENNNNYEYDYNQNGLNYIISQFVNNLSNEYTLDFNPNDPIIKGNKRKNTLESYGDESYVGQEGNLNYNTQNHFNSKYISNVKSRKNSEISVNKMIQNDKNDFKDCYRKVIGYDELNQFRPPFDNNDFKSANILDEEYPEFIKKY